MDGVDGGPCCIQDVPYPDNGGKLTTLDNSLLLCLKHVYSPVEEVSLVRWPSVEAYEPKWYIEFSTVALEVRIPLIKPEG